MTVKQKNYIDQLDLESLQILDSIIDDDSKESIEYLTERLRDLTFESDTFQYVKNLSTQIPMSYVPMFGINFHRGFWKDCSIFDYYSIPEEVKTEISFLNSVKVANLNGAVNFTLKHLQEKVKLCEIEHRFIPTGIELLNEDLEEKKELVRDQFEDIFQVLSHHEESYIFFMKNSPSWWVDSFLSFGSQKLIEILARYSDLEDLKNKNVNSFQKFIRK